MSRPMTAAEWFEKRWPCSQEELTEFYEHALDAYAAYRVREALEEATKIVEHRQMIPEVKHKYVLYQINIFRQIIADDIRALASPEGECHGKEKV